MRVSRRKVTSGNGDVNWWQGGGTFLGRQPMKAHQASRELGESKEPVRCLIGD